MKTFESTTVDAERTSALGIGMQLWDNSDARRLRPRSGNPLALSASQPGRNVRNFSCFSGLANHGVVHFASDRGLRATRLARRVPCTKVKFSRPGPRSFSSQGWLPAAGAAINCTPSPSLRPPLTPRIFPMLQCSSPPWAAMEVRVNPSQRMQCGGPSRPGQFPRHPTLPPLLRSASLPVGSPHVLAWVHSRSGQPLRRIKMCPYLK